MPKIDKLAVTGASGLIGSALVGHFKSRGYSVVKLVRRKAKTNEEVEWNPQSGYVDIAGLQGVDAVVHLAGAGVGDKRWSAAYRSEILNSRLLGTSTIAKAVNEIKPKVFISSSAIGYYGEIGRAHV